MSAIDNSSTNVSSIDILSQYGKTFHWASYVLDKTTRLAAAKLYGICRKLDDIADEIENTDDKAVLDVIQSALINYKTDQHAISDEILELSAKWDLPLIAFIDLLNGLKSDLSHVPLDKESSLELYCYQVAGTVGLLMCPLLKVKDSRAFEHAKQLGIAMQITNIVRDVYEDALMGRRYLPYGISIDDLVDPSEEQMQEIHYLRLRYIEHADELYDYALEGLAFMGIRNAFTIYLAAINYRAIGHKISKSTLNHYKKRASLSSFEKLTNSILHIPLFLLLQTKFKIKSWFANG
jgi:phytoene synthase